MWGLSGKEKVKAAVRTNLRYCIHIVKLFVAICVDTCIRAFCMLIVLTFRANSYRQTNDSPAWNQVNLRRESRKWEVTALVHGESFHEIERFSCNFVTVYFTFFSNIAYVCFVLKSYSPITSGQTTKVVDTSTNSCPTFFTDVHYSTRPSSSTLFDSLQWKHCYVLRAQSNRASFRGSKSMPVNGGKLAKHRIASHSKTASCCPSRTWKRIKKR